MAPRTESLQVLDDLIGEMAKSFPDHYFTLRRRGQWQEWMPIQRFSVHEGAGIKNNERCRPISAGRVQKHGTKHGKTVIGWDEVLVEGVPRTL